MSIYRHSIYRHYVCIQTCNVYVYIQTLRFKCIQMIMYKCLYVSIYRHIQTLCLYMSTDLYTDILSVYVYIKTEYLFSQLICLNLHKYIYTYVYIYLCICRSVDMYTHNVCIQTYTDIKLQVSFAEYRLFYRALLRKRPMMSVYRSVDIYRHNVCIQNVCIQTHTDICT